MPHDEMSFCQLKCKEIINEADGRRLGRVTDLVFSPTKGIILGIVAPFNPRNFFFKGQEVYIPFKCICKIGPDIILVKLTPELSHQGVCIDLHCGGDKKEKKDESHRRCDCHDHGHHDCRDDRHDGHRDGKKDNDCDKRCEKCMLFDCDRRWRC